MADHLQELRFELVQDDTNGPDVEAEGELACLGSLCRPFSCGRVSRPSANMLKKHYL